MSYPQTSFRHTAFTQPSLISTRRDVVSKATLRAQLDQLKSTGRYECFKLQWHPIYEDKSMWPVPFHLFWDSDIAKWIEGACYFLEGAHDSDIDATVQELVSMIRGAQQEDGYLNVHYTVVEPEKRWSNLRDMHELYNAGHLIEAAVAHHAHYKNELLVEPMKKYIALISKRFGSGQDQIKGYPGHPEIELALLRFYSATDHAESYELAKYFLTERGNPTGQEGKQYYDWETEQRRDSHWTRPDAYPENRSYWYCQAHVPIREQKTIEGHSVRAMYLLTAVADMVLLSHSGHKPLGDGEEKSWTDALQRLWNNMVDKKMYVTGGIGAIKQWEGFGIDYFLPQGTDEGGCYAETCASIGVMMLAERLLQFDLDGRYADIMELCLYNTVMTAMSADGKKFTYVNQLGSSDRDKSERNDWFWCACCPPNLTRLYGSLGGYVWSYGRGQKKGIFINVHLYTSAELSFSTDEGDAATFKQRSNWPWEGNIMFSLSTSKPISTTIRLRIPAWANGQFVLTPTPKSEEWRVEKGYLVLQPSYTEHSASFSLDIKGFAPRYLSPHPYTNQKTLALARGPVVYCVEDADNGWETNHFKDVLLKMSEPVIEEKRLCDETGQAYVALKTNGTTRTLPHGNKSPDATETSRRLVFVPYFFRANRGGNGQMRVGLINGSDSLGNVFPET